ncbi:ATP-binding protein [Citricoccus nitrophenolicus]|uniref:ATP-binding protein n=1 Tax=Citricoccus nitrophenolicus TaxID=863575 RepID=UPI0031EAF350
MPHNDDKRERVTPDNGNEIAVVSPYAGGGGGSTLGHRVATSYLADMLLGAARPETGELPVVKVAFQTNPTDPVDDLRVEAERNGDRAVVHVAVRRAPKFIKSDSKTAKLIGTLLDQVDTFEDDDRAYVAVALAGMTNTHREVQRLASLARDNSTEAEFHAQVHEPERHGGYANRYAHITGLVKNARPDPTGDDLRSLVWSLLKRLWVLDFRVESDDETDWVEIGNRLNPLARAGKSGFDVRNDLHSAQATQFDQKGTAVDRSVLRRKIHSVLDSNAGRSQAAWERLLQEQNSAMVAVRHELAEAVELPRTKLLAEAQAELVIAGAAGGSLVLTGESGTGKSSLTLSAARSLAATNRDFQYVVLNLRRTRDSVTALSVDLGMPLTDVLSEMSAPSRVLVVDAADAAVEGRGPLLRELAAAAHAAEVGLVLVAANTAAEDAAGTLVGIYPAPRRFEVPGLDDSELRVVGKKVPAIAGTLRNLPVKSLYRRMAVVDLLARTGTTVTTPLDDWGCLELIWRDLIGSTVHGSSATARTDALLAMSEAELDLPEAERSYPRPDPAALDALRADLLVAPENLRKAEPEFAHDEIRRFATAVRLVRADSVTGTLSASGPKRWAMSAAKLACEGELAGAVDPNEQLAALVAQFDGLGDESTVRWKDVPLEAALEMPNAYALLRHMLDASAAHSHDVLMTFVRVVSLHHRHDNMVDVPRGEPVVRLLIEEVDELWRNDNEVFRLVCEWLNSALVVGLPAGNPTRTALRDLLLDHWRTHHLPTAPADTSMRSDEEVVFNVFDGYTKKRVRQGALSWQITQERYIQLLALLGPDINDEVRACLSEVAADSPSSLQPAVDLDWSAWGLGAYDPKFLLQLTEAYYIDNRGSGGRRWDGIRDHEPRAFQRLNHHEYGSFWVLIRMCPHQDWVPVVNRMLNHAANISCRAEDGSGFVDPGSKFTLAIDGTEQTYVGDSNVWGWYRGNTSGPYPCMSALQAVERWVDRMVASGVAIGDVTTALLNGCENLAMPALIVGATIRHISEDSKTLDRYLDEPLIWQFEQYRVTHESVGFLQTPDDGITHPERRKWYLRDVVVFLVLNSDAQRQAEFKELSAQLVANTARFEASTSTVRRWAAALDVDNVETEPIDGGVLVSLKEPEDIEQELAPVRADLTRGDLLIRLQNKYWIPARQQEKGWTPPTPVEIADDLTLVKDLHDDPPVYAASDPNLALAYIAAAAVRSAATGHPEAFGENASFAITSILAILRQAANGAIHDINALRFENDIGTRGTAAAAVPHLVLPELAEHLAMAGTTPGDVAAAAATLGQFASTATCLEFARGCGAVWVHRCSGDPCIHLTAYQWALDLARLCEISEFDEELQQFPQVAVTGDLMARVPEIRPDRLDTSRLSATIRALGRAASSSACVAEVAQRDLEALLQAQARAMVTQELSEYAHLIDHHGAQTMSAARALLHNRLRADGTDDLLLEYVKVLAPASHVFSAFLRDLAEVGAETQELADAAGGVWPTLFAHVLDQLDANRAVYDQSDSFQDYALSHLLPNHPGTAQSLHNEFGRHPFTWVKTDELVSFIPRWLPYAAGRSSCLLELIRFLRQLPIEMQLSDGLAWLGELCLAQTDRQLASYAPMDEWLIEIKPEADARGAGSTWLNLVDRLVYAGNRALAAYSR